LGHGEARLNGRDATGQRIADPEPIQAPMRGLLDALPASPPSARLAVVPRSRVKLPDPDAVVADATLLDVLRELAPEERPRWNDWAAAPAREDADGRAEDERDRRS
jgi:hypothetical protein